MLSSSLQQSLSLPCGATLANRLAKAAMTEGLAPVDGVPGPELQQLYRLWSEGGAGMLLTGNVIVDAHHLERPGNVIVDRQPDARLHDALSAWAEAGTVGGNHLWAQISHAGRQTQRLVNPHPKAPSAVKLGLPGGQFGEPVPLTVDEIQDIVGRFAQCAAALKAAGFSGVQVHGAHGYLMSQFLSPRSNLREDDYGGSLENRARILLDTVREVRAAVGPDFPVAVKLNSADFQKGGFAFEDSLQVSRWLEDASVDLLEISGGTYEQPKLLGTAGMEEEEPQSVAPSTAQREAYFVDFARVMQDEVNIPLMVTGGFRLRDVMERVVGDGSADVVGLGRPMCVMTDAPRRVLEGLRELPRYEATLSLMPRWLDFLQGIKSVRAMSGFAVQYWYYAQLEKLGREGLADETMSVAAATRQVMAQQKAWSRARG